MATQVSVRLRLVPVSLFTSLVAIVIWFAYGSKGGRAARIAAWLGLTTLTFWVGSAIAFVGLNLVYFSLGSTATILVQNGTLNVGDVVVAGLASGRVRRMLDQHGAPLEHAGPSTPAVILGLSGLPEAGQLFQAVAAVLP